MSNFLTITSNSFFYYLTYIDCLIKATTHKGVMDVQCMNDNNVAMRIAQLQINKKSAHAMQCGNTDMALGWIDGSECP